ncbi:hypothetical protein [Limosilactobacillus sp.]|jgi:hypothetical protein|uniref:hypothetical protein n=1 Tax=Limosilactobacillus sp. TaxID=2773925 RepID=UPI0025B9CE7F|nr:hypothetical protein [Limosilactobacillus sp.]MCH3922383.1 hypothetical protein [Limosilactobacillus sp.]MCH3929155.1 hypothetical protein [Limosilactobacillus sp.]
MGPEEDLLAQAKKALKAVSAPVFYNGHPHKEQYPQIILDLENSQDEPEVLHSAEVVKLTLSVDVYTDPTQMGTLLRLNREVINVMRKVKCSEWFSVFDNYSGRNLDDEANDGHSVKRGAFLFDYFVYAIPERKDK